MEAFSQPTVGTGPIVLNKPDFIRPTVDQIPTVGSQPAAGFRPTVGAGVKKKLKPIRDVQDALTLAGQVLYKAMYGAPDGARAKCCMKGYRQLAAETYLDKDTVRDLISEFKEKGIVRETGTYDPDTRSAKTYEVLSYKSILQMWRDAGILFVTAGRQRPMFCNVEGGTISWKPTVGMHLTNLGRRQVRVDSRPTVGMSALEPPSSTAQTSLIPSAELIQVLQQITGGHVDQEAAERLIKNCRTTAADCTIEEIVEFAWSKAFLCRSGKIENPVGFLITQVPKHFQVDALQSYRDKKRKELEAAAEIAAREAERRRDSERELAEMEERHRIRQEMVGRYRKDQGIDLRSLLDDSEIDDHLKEWANGYFSLVTDTRTAMINGRADSSHGRPGTTVSALA